MCDKVGSFPWAALIYTIRGNTFDFPLFLFTFNTVTLYIRSFIIKYKKCWSHISKKNSFARVRHFVTLFFFFFCFFVFDMHLSYLESEAIHFRCFSQAFTRRITMSHNHRTCVVFKYQFHEKTIVRMDNGKLKALMKTNYCEVWRKSALKFSIRTTTKLLISIGLK